MKQTTPQVEQILSTNFKLHSKNAMKRITGLAFLEKQPLLPMKSMRDCTVDAVKYEKY